MVHISLKKKKEKSLDKHKQLKYQSLIESIINSSIGILITYVTQLIFFPMFGIYVSHGTNVGITCILFTTSFIRSYIIRRFFTKYKLKYSNK